MKIYRVRIGVLHFGMTSGFVPTCVVKIEKPDRPRLVDMLQTAFRDDPLIGARVSIGDFTVEEIDLDVEGIV